MTRTAKIVIAGALFVVLAAIVSNAQQDRSPSSSNSVYVELAKVPKKAVARPNPFATDPEASAAGAKLFARHCAECHGETGEGGQKGPSLRALEVQQATPGAIFWVLTNGVVRRGMPVWSKLPDAQRWQIVSFIKSLGAGS